MGGWDEAHLSDGVDSRRRPRSGSGKQIESELQRHCWDLTGLSVSMVASSAREEQGDDVWSAICHFREQFKAALQGIGHNQARSVGDLMAVGQALQAYVACGAMDTEGVATISRVLVAGVTTVLEANNALLL
jgi:hypothetical protein